MISALNTSRQFAPLLAKRSVQSSNFVRYFVSTSLVSDGALAEICHDNIVESPYEPIAEGPYDPFPEFMMEQWKEASGRIVDKVAIIDGSTGMQRTYNDYHTDAASLAASFRYDMGIQENDSVCFLSPNHVDYLPVVMGVALCGAKVTPANPMYTRKELAAILNISKSKVLLTHINTLETALEAAKDSEYIQQVVVLTENGAASPVQGVETLDSLKGHSKAFHTTVRDLNPNTDKHACILPFSSGTTGFPKGVCLTHSNIVANLLQVDRSERCGFKDGETLICPLPFFHIYGFTVANLYGAWRTNTVLTMSGRFDLETFSSLVQEHQPSRAYLVPPIILGLAKDPMIDNYDYTSLNTIVSGAAPLSDHIEEAVKDRLGILVKQAWGMSELSPLGTCNLDGAAKSGSIGPVVASTIGKVVDEEGKSLGPREEGELCLKGPQVMMGYLDAPDKTDECLSETGWLRTGDVAYYDEEGYFYLTDRVKELIKVRGFQVAPAELEAILLTNPTVNDVAVIQIPDEKSGELPRAYIVLKDPEQATEETKAEIYEWIKDRVAPYKRLDGGIEFLDVVPKSASGKILRRLLRDQLKEKMTEDDSASAQQQG